MVRLRDELGVGPQEIDEIRLGVLSGGYLLVADPIEQKRRPKNVVDAQFSAPFAAAVALIRGRAGIADYAQSTVDDPVVRGLMERTTCYRDGGLDAVYPAQWPAAVSVRLKSGQVLEAFQPFALGEPQNPIDRAGLTTKFRDLVDAPFADEVASAIWALPAGSVGELLSMLRREPPREAG
jgi:2-methylcitrate dehydratase PrpD